MSDADKTDEELLLDFYAGNDSALDELNRRHWQATVAAARTRCRQSDDALQDACEIAQNAWVEIACSKGTPSCWKKGGGPVVAWIMKIVFYEAVDHFRRRKKYSQDVSRDAPRGDGEASWDDSLTLQDPGPGTEKTALHSVSVERFLERLTDEEFLYVYLKDIESCSDNEAAEILNIQRQAVYRMNRRLRKMIEGMFFAPVPGKPGRPPGTRSGQIGSDAAEKGGNQNARN